MQDIYVNMRLNKLHVNIIILHVDIVILHVNINKLHVDIIISHVDIIISHVDIIILHVHISIWHVDINILHVHINKLHFISILHVDIIILHVDIFILHVDIRILHVDITSRKITRMNWAEVCHHRHLLGLQKFYIELSHALRCLPHFRSIMPPIIDLDDHRFYRLVTLSNKLAAPVLRRVIKQYCDVHGLTFEEVLNLYKHELFHYWHGATAVCCKCNGRRFTRVFIGQTVVYIVHGYLCQSPCNSCPLRTQCQGMSQRFSMLDLGLMLMCVDISLASSILTNITGKITTTHVVGLLTKTSINTSVNISGLLEYTIDQLSPCLGVNGFEQYLSKHQHKLFHQMETRRCCQCTGDPDGRSVMKLAEWSTMYNSSPTPCTFPVCSHQYSPIPGITRTSLTTQLLHRIGQAVGPVVTVRSVRNQIAHTVTGTMDDTTFTALWGELSGALHELIDIIADPAWRTDMRLQITTLDTCLIDRTMWDEYHRELHRYLEV